MYCLFRVTVTLLSSPSGLGFMGTHGASALTANVIVDYCYPQLFVTVGDVILALTMLEFLFDSSDETNLLHLLMSEHFFRAKEELMRQPLKVYANAMQGGQKNLGTVRAAMLADADKLVANQQSAMEAIKAQLEQDASDTRRTPAEREQRKHALDEANAALDEAVLRRSELAGLKAPRQGTIGRTVSRVPVGDHRYVGIPSPGPLAQFAQQLAAKQREVFGYQQRPSTIISLLERWQQKQLVRSPYFRLDEATGGLESMGDDMVDEIPVLRFSDIDEVPAGSGTTGARGPKPQKQWYVGMSIEYLSMATLLPIASEHKATLTAVVAPPGVGNPKESLALRDRLLTDTPLDRFKPVHVTYPDGIEAEGWADKLAEADPFHRLVMAIKRVLSTTTLGRPNLVNPRALPTHEPYTAEFLVYKHPPKVMLELSALGKSVPMYLNRYVQLMKVPSHRGR